MIKLIYLYQSSPLYIPVCVSSSHRSLLFALPPCFKCPSPSSLQSSALPLPCPVWCGGYSRAPLAGAPIGTLLSALQQQAGGRLQHHASHWI